MADELEPINQEVEADLSPYVEEFKRGIEVARQFADASRQDDEALNRLADVVRENTSVLRSLRDSLAEDVAALQRERDGATEAGDAIRDFGLKNAEAAAAINETRDRTVEEGIALSDLRDHAAEAGAEEDKLRDKSVEAATALGHLRDEAAGASHEVKNLGQSSEETAAKLDLMGLSGVSALGPLAQMVPLMAALGVAAAAVAPAAAAAGLGVGAFGVMAIPALTQISSAYQRISADQQAVAAATTAAAKSTALAQLKHDMDGLSAPVANVLREITSLKNEFTSLAKSSGITTDVFNDIGKAIGLIRELLPVIVPLAQQGAVAINHMLTAMQAAFKSQGFLDFMRTMTALVVPAMAAIGRLSGALLGLLGHALVSLAPMAVPFINVLTAIVNALSGPLGAVLHVVISLFLGLAGAIVPLLPGLSKLATLLINDIGSSFQEFIPIIAQVVALLGGALLKILMDLEPVFANALEPNSPFMSALRMLPPILNFILPLFTHLASILSNPFFAHVAVDALSAYVAFKAVQGVLSGFNTAFTFVTKLTLLPQVLRESAVAARLYAAAQWLLDAAMDANPITLIIIALVALAAIFVVLWLKCAAFRAFWKSLWHDIENITDAAREGVIKAFNAVVSFLKTAVTDVVNFIKGHWMLLVGILLGPIALIAALLITYWSQITNGVSRMVSDVVGWFRRLPGWILGVVSGFGHLLWNAGVNLIQGLINGVEGAVGGLLGTISHIGSMVSNAFSSILHMFSPSQVFHNHGMMIMQGLINGIMAGAPAVHAAMASVANALASQPLATSSVAYGGATGGAGGGFGGATAGAAAPGGNLIVQVNGQTLFEIAKSQLYQYNIRNSGQVTGVAKPS
jgi:phage-related protein